MSYAEDALKWYYTLKAMNDAIINKQHHSLFVLTNYRNIRNDKYEWKKDIRPQDKAALMRVINADIISQAIKGIESLFQLANVGLLAKEKGVDYNKMNRWYFFTRMKDLDETMKIFEEEISLEDWKWILWISDLDEIKSEQIYNKDELLYIEKIYHEYLNRSKFVFTYALKFWRLLKPVRDAFSHTLRFIPFPNITHNMPEGYDDILLVLDCNWEGGNPIRIPVITGFNVLRILSAFIDFLNQFEMSIIKNHTLSVQSEGKRLLPVISVKKSTEESEYYASLHKKYSKLEKINVGWKTDDLVDDIKPQFELYISFWEKLQKLGQNFSFPEE
ncbi:MAG: hypothetical protein ACFFDS_08170 [Candidatus Thorarchaeota archaeon]